jgi:hypothetical protein
LVICGQMAGKTPSPVQYNWRGRGLTRGNVYLFLEYSKNGGEP